MGVENWKIELVWFEQEKHEDNTPKSSRWTCYSARINYLLKKIMWIKNYQSYKTISKVSNNLLSISMDLKDLMN